MELGFVFSWGYFSPVYISMQMQIFIFIPTFDTRLHSILKSSKKARTVEWFGMVKGLYEVCDAVLIPQQGGRVKDFSHQMQASQLCPQQCAQHSCKWKSPVSVQSRQSSVSQAVNVMTPNVTQQMSHINVTNKRIQLGLNGPEQQEAPILEPSRPIMLPAITNKRTGRLKPQFFILCFTQVSVCEISGLLLRLWMFDEV